MPLGIGISPKAVQTGGGSLTTGTGFNSNATGTSQFIVSFTSTTNTGASASDNMGNSYTLLQQRHDTVNGIYISTFGGNTSNGGTNHTFTASLSSGSIESMEGIEVLSSAGIDISNNYFNAGSGFPYSTALSTTAPNELVYAFGCLSQIDSTYYPVTNGGFTQLNINVVDQNFGSGWVAAPTTGSYDPAWTRSGGSSIYLSAIMVAFQPIIPPFTLSEDGEWFSFKQAQP